MVNNQGMETLLFTGVFLAISANHMVWTMSPSAQQLENERYWEMKIKGWQIEREREERQNN